MSRNHQKSVAARITGAARLYRSRVGAALAPLGLHAGQEAVLKALDRTDGQSMTTLALALGVQPPTVTKMVGRLVTQGYVERRASHSDGRQAHVFLTEQGTEALAEVDGVLADVERRALAGIDDKDGKRLGRLLRRVMRNLADGGEEEDEPEETAVDAADAAA